MKTPEKVEAVLLRTLTEKSRLRFGKYADVTVGELLRCNKSMYLGWTYYNVRGVSFTEEILTAMHIYPEMRIPKPGTAPDIYDRFCNKQLGRMRHVAGAFGMLKYHQHAKKRRKAICISKAKSAYISKAAMQSINHGH